MFDRIKNFLAGIGAGILAVLFAAGVAFFTKRNNREFYQEQKKANDKLKEKEKELKDQAQDVVEGTDKLKEKSDQVEKESDQIKEEAAEAESDFRDHFNVVVALFLIPAMLLAMNVGVIAANETPEPKEVSIEDLKMPEIPEDPTKEELIELCNKLIDKYKDMGQVAIRFRSLYYETQGKLDQLQEINDKLETKLDELIEINNKKDKIIAEKDDIINKLLNEQKGLNWGIYTGVNYPPLNPTGAEISFGTFFNF